MFIGMYSVNYERLLYYSNHFQLNASAGAGGWYFTTISKWYLGYSLPLSINSLIGSKNNFFETEIGLRYTFFNEKSDEDLSPIFPLFNLGYRYQNLNGKGLIFRCFIGYNGLGIGIGKAF